MPRYYRLRIRNAADTADALVLSSYSGDTNPYIVAAPEGDGESFDEITGAPTTGSYTVRVADPVTSASTRVITSQLADALARQQLLMRKVWIEESSTGSAWSALVVGYLTAIRLIDAITFEFAIGQSRRIEQSYTVWKEATATFPGVTCVIGGPVIGGFINNDFLRDNGGWTMQVDQDTATHTRLKLIQGFDPRKPEQGTFTSTSTAIADFTNDWARNYFEPSDQYTASQIGGHFPGLRARLEPTAGGDPIILVPLARPSTLGGVWYNPTTESDKLTGSGTSQLYLPKVDVAGAAFDPAAGTQYYVYVYAVAVSAKNPMHWYGHPVDLWQDFRDDAGIAYDASVLPALKALIGESMRLALRPTSPLKLSDADRSIIYGPFRLSSRIEDGEEILFSTDTTENAAPATTIALADLRGDGGTVFDLDESTITTDITLKSKRIIKWTSDDADQPEIDALISREAYPQTIQNSDDDIPPGSTNEQTMGDIPGSIWLDGYGPANMEAFIANLAFEMFERAGRGFIACNLECLPAVTAKVGEEVLLDLPHMPGAVVGQSPVSQRSADGMTAHPFAAQPFQIVQRTESPEGPTLKLVNSISTSSATAVVPAFALAVSATAPGTFGLVPITNADALAAAGLNVRVDYAVSASSPATGAGTHLRTVLASEMTSPTHSLDVGPVTAGAKLWVQIRAQKSGLRPGSYTAWQSVDLVSAALSGTMRHVQRLPGATLTVV